jgi:hypothetical protein
MNEHSVVQSSCCHSDHPGFLENTKLYSASRHMSLHHVATEEIHEDLPIFSFWLSRLIFFILFYLFKSAALGFM